MQLYAQGKVKAVERRPTISEGLYSGLSRGNGLAVTQLDAKMQLLVEAPAAVEDALASLLDDADPQLRVRWSFEQQSVLLQFWEHICKAALDHVHHAAEILSNCQVLHSVCKP